MKIKRVTLSGFGALSNFQAEFSDQQINIILGDNESGKSTLCSAIEAIPYGFSSKSNADIRHSWGFSGDYIGTLHINLNGNDIIIKRDFSDNHVNLIRIAKGSQEILFDGDANPKGRTEQPIAYRKLLDDLGFPPDTIFRSAIYIGQLDLEIEIDDDLRQQLSGAGKADYLNALEDLQKNYYSLTRQNLPGDNPKRTDRKLEEAHARKRCLIEEYEQARTHSSDLVDVEGELENSTRLFYILSDRKNEIEAEKRLINDYLSYLKECDTLNQRIKLEKQQQEQTERLRRAVDDVQQQLEGERFVAINKLSDPAFIKLEEYVQSDVEETIRDIQSIRLHEEEIKNELKDKAYTGFLDALEDTGTILKNLSDDKKILEELEKQAVDIELVHRKSSRVIPILTLIIMSALGVVGGTLLSLRFMYSVIVGGVFGLVIVGGLTGFIVFFIMLFQNKRSGDKDVKRLAVQTQMEDKRRAYQKALTLIEPIIKANEPDIAYEVLAERWKQFQDKRGKITKLNEKLKYLSEREILQIRDDPTLKPIIDSAPMAILRERLKEYHALKTKLATNKENLHSINAVRTSPSSGEDPDDRFRELVILIEQLEKKHSGLIAFREDRQMGYSRLNALQSEFESSSAKINQLDEKIRSLQVHQGQLQVSAFRNPELIEEEIQNVEYEIRRLDARTSALRIAIEILAESISEYEENHFSRLSTIVSSHFSKFTHGRYERVEILSENFPKIITATGVSVEPSQLSTGAKDQLFFALRLAIADLMSSELSLPLILDDTFVNFDQRRLNIIHDTLDALVGERQIILLTHNNIFEDWAGNLLKI